MNATRGENFTFACSAPKAVGVVEFTVLIDAHNDSRIIKGINNTNNTQDFIFTKTTYLDNGTVLQCVANSVYKSVNESVIIFCKHIYIVLYDNTIAICINGVINLSRSTDIFE